MGIGDLTERLKDLPGQVGQGKMEDAKATAGDGAERLEAAAEQLAALHRAIVAPQVDELAKVEAKLAGLDEQLDQLDTPTKITGWHMEADELLDELDKAGVAERAAQEFLEEMKKAGWGDTARGKLELGPHRRGQLRRSRRLSRAAVADAASRSAAGCRS